MKQFPLCFALLALVLAGFARAQTYDPAVDFSATSNPNGVWSYGWSASIGGAFVPYDFHRQIGFIGPPGADQWLSSNYNPTGYQDVLLWNNKLLFTTDVTPSQVNIESIVRWTCPAAGSYAITGSFAPFYIAGTPYGNSVHVRQRTAQGMVSAFDGTVNNSQAMPFSLTMSMASGDNVDFVAGYGQRLILSAQISSRSIQFTSPATTPPVQMPPTVLTRVGCGIPLSADWKDLEVIVREGNLQPITSPVELFIVISSTDNASGHLHPNSTTTRPHGWVFDAATTQYKLFPGLLAGAGLSLQNRLPYGTVGGDQTTTGISVWTVNGRAQFRYLAPEVAGKDTVTVEIIGDTSTPPLTANVDVSVTGLAQLPFVSTWYQPYGVTTNHGSNYNGTWTLIARIQTAATIYHDLQVVDPAISLFFARARTALEPLLTPAEIDMYVPVWEPIYVNDISLPKGGLFDADGLNFAQHEWAPPHVSHREGRNVDIRTSHLVNGNPLSPSSAVGAPGQSVAVNNIVKRCQWLRVALLRRALGRLPAGAGGLFYSEGRHFHVTF